MAPIARPVHTPAKPATASPRGLNSARLGLGHEIADHSAAAVAHERWGWDDFWTGALTNFGSAIALVSLFYLLEQRFERRTAAVVRDAVESMQSGRSTKGGPIEFAKPEPIELDQLTDTRREVAKDLKVAVDRLQIAVLTPRTPGLGYALDLIAISRHRPWSGEGRKDDRQTRDFDLWTRVALEACRRRAPVHSAGHQVEGLAYPIIVGAQPSERMADPLHYLRREGGAPPFVGGRVAGVIYLSLDRAEGDTDLVLKTAPREALFLDGKMKRVLKASDNTTPTRNPEEEDEMRRRALWEWLGNVEEYQDFSYSSHRRGDEGDG